MIGYVAMASSGSNRTGAPRGDVNPFAFGSTRPIMRCRNYFHRKSKATS